MKNGSPNMVKKEKNTVYSKEILTYFMKEFLSISKARYPQIAHATAGTSLVLLFQSVSCARYINTPTRVISVPIVKIGCCVPLLTEGS